MTCALLKASPSKDKKRVGKISEREAPEGQWCPGSQLTLMLFKRFDQAPTLLDDLLLNGSFSHPKIF